MALQRARHRARVAAGERGRGAARALLLGDRVRFRVSRRGRRALSRCGTRTSRTRTRRSPPSRWCSRPTPRAGCECTIVRPGDVYGPRSRAWAMIPAQLIRDRRFTFPAAGGGSSPRSTSRTSSTASSPPVSTRGAGEMFTLPTASASRTASSSRRTPSSSAGGCSRAHAGRAGRRRGDSARRPAAPGGQRHKPGLGRATCCAAEPTRTRRRGGCWAGSPGRAGRPRAWGGRCSRLPAEGYAAATGPCPPAPPACAAATAARRPEPRRLPRWRTGRRREQPRVQAERPLVEPVDVGLPGEADPAVGLDRAGGNVPSGSGRGGGRECRRPRQALGIGVGRPRGEEHRRADALGVEQHLAQRWATAWKEPTATPNCLRSLTYSSVISSAR